MLCLNCGTQLAEDNKYCYRCGVATGSGVNESFSLKISEDISDPPDGSDDHVNYHDGLRLRTRRAERKRRMSLGHVLVVIFLLGSIFFYLRYTGFVFHGTWKNNAGIKTLAAGSENHGSFTIGVKEDGTVIATGVNTYGQCDVSEWHGIIAVSASAIHSVGLREDGSVVAAGNNEWGQCDVSEWQDIIDVSAGAFCTIGLKEDGTVLMAGTFLASPEDLTDWSDIVSVAACTDHAIGIKADGTVVATGNNDRGQCDVSAWTDIACISTTETHTVGLKEDGTVVITGEYDSGAGDRIASWRNIVAVYAYFGQTWGLTSGGKLVHRGECYQWDRKQTLFFSPNRVSSWRNIVSLAIVDTHMVGLRRDGSVVAATPLTYQVNIYGECDVEDWTLRTETATRANEQAKIPILLDEIAGGGSVMEHASTARYSLVEAEKKYPEDFAILLGYVEKEYINRYGIAESTQIDTRAIFYNDSSVPSRVAVNVGVYGIAAGDFDADGTLEMILNYACLNDYPEIGTALGEYGFFCYSLLLDIERDRDTNETSVSEGRIGRQWLSYLNPYDSTMSEGPTEDIMTLFNMDGEPYFGLQHEMLDEEGVERNLNFAYAIIQITDDEAGRLNNTHALYMARTRYYTSEEYSEEGFWQTTVTRGDEEDIIYQKGRGYEPVTDRFTDFESALAELKRLAAEDGYLNPDIKSQEFLIYHFNSDMDVNAYEPNDGYLKISYQSDIDDSWMRYFSDQADTMTEIPRPGIDSDISFHKQADELTPYDVVVNAYQQYENVGFEAGYAGQIPDAVIENVESFYIDPNGMHFQYALEDLSGDTVPELIISLAVENFDRPQILEVYTIDAMEAVSLVYSSLKEDLSILTDNKICLSYYHWQGQSRFRYYEFTNEIELHFIEQIYVYYDESTDENVFGVNYNESDDFYNYETVTQEEFEAIRNKYAQEKSFDWRPLGDW